MSLTQGEGSPAAQTETPAAATATTATTTTPEATPPKDQDQFSKKFEILAKRERALYRERQAILQERERIAKDTAEIEQIKTLKQSAKQRPLDYLQAAGLSYDDLTNYVLNGGKQTEKDELQEVREEMRKMRESQEEKERRSLEMQTQAQHQAEVQVIEDFKSNIGDFLNQNKDKFELCASREATEDVFSTINDQFVIALNEWNREGRLGPKPAPMTIEEAAKIVEDFYEKEIMRLAEVPKIKSKFAPPPTEAPASRQPSKTLTNNMSSTAASVVPAKTDNDRMQRALAKLT